VDAVKPASHRIRTVAETLLPGELPLFAIEQWQSRFPWLFHATTGAGSPDEPFDLSFFGSTRAGTVMEHWRDVRSATGFDRIVHARQVHEATVLVHTNTEPGINIRDDADGHVTTVRGVLLAVSVADCVPVFIVDAKARAIALLHAGWRGCAAGILEDGLRTLQRVTYVGLNDVHVHFGPSICGDCYQVGPEVFQAMKLPVPATSTPLDLRAALADRARSAGVPADNISISRHCTRCGEGFFSHRRGHRERQMALLGLRLP